MYSGTPTSRLVSPEASLPVDRRADVPRRQMAEEVMVGKQTRDVPPDRATGIEDLGSRFTVQLEGPRGGKTVLYQGGSEERANATFERAATGTKQAVIVLRRLLGGKVETLRRCEIIPMARKKRTGNRYLPMSPNQMAKIARESRPPGTKRIRVAVRAVYEKGLLVKDDS